MEDQQEQLSEPQTSDDRVEALPPLERNVTCSSTSAAVSGNVGRSVPRGVYEPSIIDVTSWLASARGMPPGQEIAGPEILSSTNAHPSTEQIDSKEPEVPPVETPNSPKETAPAEKPEVTVAIRLPHFRSLIQDIFPRRGKHENAGPRSTPKIRIDADWEYLKTLLPKKEGPTEKQREEQLWAFYKWKNGINQSETSETIIQQQAYNRARALEPEKFTPEQTGCTACQLYQPRVGQYSPLPQSAPETRTYPGHWEDEPACEQHLIRHRRRQDGRASSLALDEMPPRHQGPRGPQWYRRSPRYQEPAFGGVMDTVPYTEWSLGYAFMLLFFGLMRVASYALAGGWDIICALWDKAVSDALRQNNGRGSGRFRDGYGPRARNHRDGFYDRYDEDDRDRQDYEDDVMESMGFPRMYSR